MIFKKKSKSKQNNRDHEDFLQLKPKRKLKKEKYRNARVWLEEDYSFDETNTNSPFDFFQTGEA